MPFAGWASLTITTISGADRHRCVRAYVFRVYRNENVWDFPRMNPNGDPSSCSVESVLTRSARDGILRGSRAAFSICGLYRDPWPHGTIIILRGSSRLLSKNRTSAVESDSPVACAAWAQRRDPHANGTGHACVGLPATQPCIRVRSFCARITKWMLAAGAAICMICASL